MASTLLICLSDKEITKGYRFKITNINVFSFEEALYHCYHYWRESLDDFCEKDFIEWVGNTLELSYIASQIRELASLPGLSDKLTRFLTLTDYFDEEEIGALKIELQAFENRMEWEKLKERADLRMNQNDPAKAFALYKRALQHGENSRLLNNAGIALLKLRNYEQAYAYLEKAHQLEMENMQILLNTAESAIYSGYFEKAEELLIEAEEAAGEVPDVLYLYGEMCFEKGDVRGAVSYFERAIAASQEHFYIYRLSDAYAKLRLYDKALDNLSRISVKSREFLMKQAEIYVLAGNPPAAIKCMERALISSRDDIELWVRLAIYHRLDYDISRAESAINKALGIDPHHEGALIESARIKKLQGRTKDYQVILSNILKGFKSKYRESLELE